MRTANTYTVPCLTVHKTEQPCYNFTYSGRHVVTWEYDQHLILLIYLLITVTSSILLFIITLHTEKNYSSRLYLINSVESAFFYALKYISDILYPALDRVTNITKTLCMAVDCNTTCSIVRHLSHNCIIYGTGTGTSGRKIRARSQVSRT